jgi:DNA-binding response OmpR family regulator
MFTARVLLIDDDRFYARRARIVFDVDSHIDLRVVTTTAAASAAIEQWRPDIVILDLVPADSCSFVLLDTLRARRRASRIGIICLAEGAGSGEDYHHCTDGGQFLGVLRRDAGPEALWQAVTIAVAATRLEAAAA